MLLKTPATAERKDKGCTEIKQGLLLAFLSKHFNFLHKVLVHYSKPESHGMGLKLIMFPMRSSLIARFSLSRVANKRLHMFCFLHPLVCDPRVVERGGGRQRSHTQTFMAGDIFHLTGEITHFLLCFCCCLFISFLMPLFRSGNLSLKEVL